MIEHVVPPRSKGGEKREKVSTHLGEAKVGLIEARKGGADRCLVDKGRVMAEETGGGRTYRIIGGKDQRSDPVKRNGSSSK